MATYFGILLPRHRDTKMVFFCRSSGATSAGLHDLRGGVWEIDSLFIQSYSAAAAWERNLSGFCEGGGGGGEGQRPHCRRR